MSPDLALTFDRYSLREVPGGWVARCQCCERERQHGSVDGVLAWEHDHTCATPAVAAATRRTAAAILARLTPDPLHVVLERRAAIVDALDGFRLSRRAAA